MSPEGTASPPPPEPARTTVAALVSLGSNIEPRRNLRRALAELAGVIEITTSSSLYASPAKGAPGTPPFLNAAVAVATALTPRELKFDLLRPLEARMGRRRGEDPNAPRVIDLDLSLYGDLVIDSPRTGIVLPDPEILTSAHVVLPLAEIAPGWRHPTAGRQLSELAAPFRDDPEIRVVGRLGD